MSDKAMSAVQKTINFGSEATIEGFLIETGEIRYSKTGASVLLGYAPKWINGLRSDSPKVLEVLLSKGYTDYAQRVSVKRASGRGATIAETISGDDLDVLISVEAERGNKKATALLVSGWRQYRIDQSRLTFGLAERSQEEKLADFDQWYEAYLANCEDWAVIEEQEQFLNQESKSLPELYAEIPTANSYEEDPDCFRA